MLQQTKQVSFLDTQNLEAGEFCETHEFSADAWDLIITNGAEKVNDPEKASTPLHNEWQPPDRT